MCIRDRLALEASILTQGAHGPRHIPADQFFIGSFRTALESDEVITSVHIPLPKTGQRSAYEKFKNPANGYPVVGVAASLVRQDDGTIVSCRLGLTGSEAHPQRLYQAEEALKGKKASAAAFAAAISQGVACLLYTSDVYKRQALRLDTRRCGEPLPLASLWRAWRRQCPRHRSCAVYW